MRVRLRVGMQDPALVAHGEAVLAALRAAGIAAEAVPARVGEFGVLVDNLVVAKKGWLGLPDPGRVVRAVQAALAAG